jgi:cellulose 1,4-beta-cellobiosidase
VSSHMHHEMFQANETDYEMFNLIGNEFTFDVDLSQLPCGLNGALYFVSMPQKGQGTPGAKYGTGRRDTPSAAPW